jgi:hypothetical protein
MDDQKIIDDAPEGAMMFSDVESVYIKWLKPQAGIFENHGVKYGILYWDEKFKEWDYVGAISAAKLLCSSRLLADIKELVELRNEKAELKKTIKELTDGVTHFNRTRGDINPLLEAYTRALKTGN